MKLTIKIPTMATSLADLPLEIRLMIWKQAIKNAKYDNFIRQRQKLLSRYQVNTNVTLEKDYTICFIKSDSGKFRMGIIIMYIESDDAVSANYLFNNKQLFTYFSNIYNLENRLYMTNYSTDYFSTNYHCTNSF